jgi:preprotein translocase subunit SecG
MLTAFILVIHVVVCVALILIILLQTGKGADIGAAFGGGSSQTIFGSTGATPFLSKVTIGAAVVFMITSIILTYFADKGFGVRERSIVSEQSVPVSSPVGQGVPAPNGTTQTGGGETPEK